MTPSNPANELRTIVAVGARLPLTAGSAGKVFLAWASPSDRDRLIRGTALTDAPGRPSADAGGRDRATARLGDERRANARAAWRSVSAPVRGADEEPVAVVSISGPITRVGTRDDVAPRGGRRARSRDRGGRGRLSTVATVLGVRPLRPLP